MFNSSASQSKVSPLAEQCAANGRQSRKNGRGEHAEGLQKPAEEAKTAWACIYLCTFFTFTCSMQFTLFLTSLWPFMRILDGTVTEGIFGLVICMYSVSQIIASPLLGIWANRIERLKPPLLFCNLTMFLGNALYFFVELFPAEHSRYVLIVSRFVAGMGWAQVALLKSYASAASVAKDRARATAWITGGNAIGTTVGPAFQMLFTVLDYPGVRLVCIGGRFLNMSMFTAPALFACSCNIVLMFLLVLWFRESYVGVMDRKKPAKPNGTVEVISIDEMPKKAVVLPPYDRVAVAVCCAMRFTQYFTFTNIETIGPAFAMMMFMWTPTELVLWEAIAHSLRGIMSILVYALYITFDLGKMMSHRFACMIGLLCLLLFHVFTYSWPFLPENVHQFDSSLSMNSTNGTSPTSSNPFSELGCDVARMTWCDGMTRINVWVYYAAIIVLMGGSFPNINVNMNTLFSHIVGPRLQSKQQGMLEMYGGMGRMLGPLMIGFLYIRYGPRAIWLLEGGEVVLMIALWAVFYRRLVPLAIPLNILKTESPEAVRKPSVADRIARFSVSGHSFNG